MSRSLVLASMSMILLSSAASSAATPEAIARSISRGATFLKADLAGSNDENAVGASSLAGLALLESGVPAQDPAIQALRQRLRDNTYSEARTYNLALALMFFDRLGHPEDVPWIQMLACRLLVGQQPNGGWDYESILPIPEAMVQELKKNLRTDELVAGDIQSPAKPLLPGGNRMHAEVVKQSLRLRRVPDQATDNSNTQFAVLAIWIARRHGVDVERSLALIEQRFLRTQKNDGTWSYHPPEPMGQPDHASPSMTCSGLLAIATSLARREERNAAAPKAAAGVRPVDPREVAARRGFAALAQTLAALEGPARADVQRGDGDGDLYYLWSVERVCVIYKIEKLAGVDWYAVGSDALVRSQNANGSWNYRPGSTAGTALAILFLCRSNLAKDLKGVGEEQFTELRSTARLKENVSSAKVTTPKVELKPAGPTLPTPATDQGVLLAAELLKAPANDWSTLLVRLRDEKGPSFTRGLVLAVNKLDGDRKKEARDALADRLTRMTVPTLREMLGSEEAELRRAAVLASAMKEEKDLIPDLIRRIRDDSPVVWPAARAGLRGLTGQDFGPPTAATAEDRSRAQNDWNTWYARTKK